MTTAPASGSLTRRLLAAFVLVALSSVAVLTFAALVATDQGLASAQRDERAQVADRVADAASAGYTAAGGWASADLAPAHDLAEAAGAHLVVRDADGTMVWPGRGMGRGMGGAHSAAAVVNADVTAGGELIGTVRLGFADGAAAGRPVAWSWVLGAGVVALLAALAVSGYVSRRLTRPLVTIADAARRFAAGEHTARARVRGPGELGELASAFDTMADEVVRTQTVRRRLAADVAHELRTPLAALQAGLEELRDGLRTADPRRLGELHDQALRLGRVVQDLADLSAAESAALSLRPVDADLAEIARAAVTAQGPQLTSAGLTVEVDLDLPLPVRADPDRLHQAVANVLANAARYCRSGDQLTARGRARDGYAELEIADTGPGIPADELPYVFERLWRGRRARSVTGSGIGLAVVRELVTAHGGTVDLRSPARPDASGPGTAVVIRLPYRQPHVSMVSPHPAHRSCTPRDEGRG